jgi:outer membrane lipoprotein SlyB
MGSSLPSRQVMSTRETTVAKARSGDYDWSHRAKDIAPHGSDCLAWYKITQRKMIMLTRFIQRLGLWTSVCLLVAATGRVVMAQSPVRAEEGKVETIELYRAPGNKLVNGGAVIGGIAGGVIGHQIGSGRGNAAATIAGALGGTLVGSQIEATRYRITVRLDSGSSLIVEDQRDLNLRVGDRVGVEDGHVHRI